MSDVPMKPGNRQPGIRSSSPFRLGESPLRQGTPYWEDPIYTNSVPSLSMTSSPAVSYPPTPRGSLSRSSSPALNDSHRSAPIASALTSTPLLDSRSCSPYSFIPPSTYHSPPASPTSRSKESSPVRSSELYTGRWISQKAGKHCPEPLSPSSPLRAPPMLAAASSSSSASSLSGVSGISYGTNTSLSTQTSFWNSQFILDLTPPTEITVATLGHKRSSSTYSTSPSLLQCRSISESISDTCERLCEKLKKSLRVMWKQGNSCEVERRTEAKTEEAVEMRSATMSPSEPVAAVETQVKDGSSESMAKRWKRKSADSIRTLEKAYRQGKDSATKMVEGAIDSGPSPSSDKPVEKNLPPVPEVADFVDLRDPFACHTSGSPQVVKNTASALPPPSFKCTAKVIEARRRARRMVAPERTGSVGKSGSSIKSGTVGRSGSAGSASGRPRPKFERRVGASMWVVPTRRLRPITPKRSFDAKPFPVTESFVPLNDSTISNPPFAYKLAPVRPLRVRKHSEPSTPSRPLVMNTSAPYENNESLIPDAPAPLSPPQTLAAPQRRHERLVAMSSLSTKPLTSLKDPSSSRPYILTSPTGPVINSFLPTPPLTPSSPVPHSYFSTPSTSSSSLPWTPVKARGQTGGQGI